MGWGGGDPAEGHGQQQVQPLRDGVLVSFEEGSKKLVRDVRPVQVVALLDLLVVDLQLAQVPDVAALVLKQHRHVQNGD